MSHGRKRNRREFLKARPAVDVLADLADAAGGQRAAPPSPDAGSAYLWKASRRAMACRFEIFLNAGQFPQGPQAALAALDLVDELEDQLSVFRDTSEITRLNRQAATSPVVVEERLFSLLRLAIDLYHETAGAFDVTAGALSRAWGFSRRAGAVPAPAELAAALNNVGSDKLRLDPTAHSVAFAQSGLEINLGAIGKGYALDRCALHLAAEGVTSFLLHAGSSSVLARGSRAGGAAWRVAIAHPLLPGRNLAEIDLRDRALATSGAGAQFFRHDGKRYGHILDPGTGQPASGVFSSTVAAPSAAMADALSTAFYILGPALAQAYCAAHEGVSALLVLPSPDGSAVETAQAGFAEGELHLSFADRKDAN